MTGFGGQAEELLAEYRRQRARIGEMQRKISEISASVTAPRQEVTVTVGAQGEVRAIEFPTSAYRRMAPAELSEVLMTALTQGREKAQAALGELMAAELPGPGQFATDLIRGKGDLSALLPEDPPMPDMVRDYIEGGYSPSRVTGQ